MMCNVKPVLAVGAGRRAKHLHGQRDINRGFWVERRAGAVRELKILQPLILDECDRQSSRGASHLHRLQPRNCDSKQFPSRPH